MRIHKGRAAEIIIIIAAFIYHTNVVGAQKKSGLSSFTDPQPPHRYTTVAEAYARNYTTQKQNNKGKEQTKNTYEEISVIR